MALKQYQRVKMELFEAQLKSDALEADDELTPVQRKIRQMAMARRVEKLRQSATALREAAQKLQEEIDVNLTK